MCDMYIYNVYMYICIYTYKHTHTYVARECHGLDISDHNPRRSKCSNQEYLAQTVLASPCTETQSPHCIGAWTLLESDARSGGLRRDNHSVRTRIARLDSTAWTEIPTYQRSSTRLDSLIKGQSCDSRRTLHLEKLLGLARPAVLLPGDSHVVLFW